jgi:hydroxypyruvate isomerase
VTLTFGANRSLRVTEVPLLERPAAARAAGFDVVESWWPFATAVPDSREVDAFVAAVGDAGVRLEALNFFAGDMPGGDRGVVSVPGREAEFGDSVDVLASIAVQTGCTLFNALYGVRVERATAQQQDDLAAENLALAAAAVAPFGGTVLLEPLTTGENGAYPLTSPDEVLSVIRRVRADSGAVNLKLLADFYHLTMNGFGWEQVIERYFPDFGHVQVADAPGRHQPGTGAIAFDKLFAALEDGGYEGCVGLEYRPEGSTEDSLEWLPRAARASNGASA